MQLSKEEHIIICAEKLFAKKGFDGTSTREICRTAEVNVSMISYYFGSKEKLYEQIFRYRTKQSMNFVDLLLHREDLNAWEKVETLLKQYIRRVRTYWDFYKILYREQISVMKNEVISGQIIYAKKQFYKAYQSILEQGVEEKLFKPQVGVEYIQSTISGTLVFAMNAQQFYKENLPPTENFNAVYGKNLENHLRNLLKFMLGYEENVQ